MNAITVGNTPTRRLVAQMAAAALGTALGARLARRPLPFELRASWYNPAGPRLPVDDLVARRRDRHKRERRNRAKGRRERKSHV